MVSEPPPLHSSIPSITRYSLAKGRSMIPGKPSKSVVGDASDHSRCDLRLPCRALCIPRQPISVDAIHDPSGPAKIASKLAHWRPLYDIRQDARASQLSSRRLGFTNLPCHWCCASETPNFKSTSCREPAPSHTCA